MMRAYQERVITEQAELHTKVEKLSEFISTDVFSGLGHDEQQRLTEQLHHMKKYDEVLVRRIQAF